MKKILCLLLAFTIGTAYRLYKRMKRSFGMLFRKHHSINHAIKA